MTAVINWFTVMTKDQQNKLQERIVRNSVLHPETGCWIWMGNKNNGGYPCMAIRVPGGGSATNPKRYYVHRVSYEVFKLKPRKKGEVAHSHKCLSQLCVNPDHLRKTTRSSNERDKKRAAKWKRIALRELPGPSTSVLVKTKRRKPCRDTSDLEVPF